MLGTVDRIEGDIVIIRLENNQFLHWAKDKFSFVPKEGQIVTLSISTDQNKTNQAKMNAKEILNEIITTA